MMVTIIITSCYNVAIMPETKFLILSWHIVQQKNYPAVVLKSNCSSTTLTAASPNNAEKAPLYKYIHNC